MVKKVNNNIILFLFIAKILNFKTNVYLYVGVFEKIFIL
jgi:hypothetical protein